MLFVCDLDGTLLDHTHDIDDIVLNGIRKVLAEGHYFAICTGRSMHDPKQINFGIRHDHMYTIAMNGAIIYKDEGDILLRKPIDKDIVKASFYDLKDIFVRYETDTMCYYPFTYLRADRYLYDEEIYKSNHEQRMAFYKVNSKFEAGEEEILAHDIYKINFSLGKEKTKKTADRFVARFSDRVANAPWGDGFYDITDKKANKGDMTRWLADRLGIAYDDVHTYGDSYNDKELMEMFTNSSCPSNAIDEIKMRAKRIIGDYDDHSVIKDILAKIDRSSHTS